jgi:Cu+-exporting ATPase
VVVIDGSVAALLRFRDAPRADGQSFVRHLGPAHRLDRVMLVSGDRESEVKWLADTVGITEVHAGIQPEGKLKIVEEAVRQAPVVFVGDGINDAPALAAADVGIAMGTGSDAAIESAGVTLVKGDLRGIIKAIELSRHTMRNIRQNLFFAFIYNAVGVPLAAGVLYPFFGILLSPMIAGAAMSFSSVSVIMNALRLRKTEI